MTFQYTFYRMKLFIATTKKRFYIDFCSVLGVLIYAIHSANKKPFKLFGTNLESYKAFAMDLKFGKYPTLNCVPSGIVDNVRLMLHYNPDTRPNLYELLKVFPFDFVGKI